MDEEEEGEINEEPTQEVVEEEEEEEETENEQKFWKTAYDQAKITKSSWVAGCRKYNIPVSRKGLALACPSACCIKQQQYMFPSYIPCSSKTGGGKYVGMVYNCIGCSADATSREEEQETNIWSNYLPSKFALRYTQRARKCGVENISTIPVPYTSSSSNEQKTETELTRASVNLPTNFDFQKCFEEIIEGQRKLIGLLMKDLGQEQGEEGEREGEEEQQQ